MVAINSLKNRTKKSYFFPLPLILNLLSETLGIFEAKLQKEKIIFDFLPRLFAPQREVPIIKLNIILWK